MSVISDVLVTSTPSEIVSERGKESAHGMFDGGLVIET